MTWSPNLLTNAQPLELPTEQKGHKCKTAIACTRTNLKLTEKERHVQHAGNCKQETLHIGQAKHGKLPCTTPRDWSINSASEHPYMV